MSYTYVRLPISREAYTEIKTKLQNCGYEHAVRGDDLDMHGLGLIADYGPEWNHEALFGSDTLPSEIVIGKLTVSLGDLVRGAFERTGMEVVQWNKMDARLRDAILRDSLSLLRENEQ